MNFTTDLPKKDPLVSYIVASAVKCEKFFPGSIVDGPVYRMHAVILKKKNIKLELPALSPEQAHIQQWSSQEHPEDINQDSGSKTQPRSMHGRVLTQSRRLKAAHGEHSPVTAVAPQHTHSNKNYILCHVRRVYCKVVEDDNTNVASGVNQSNTQKIHHSQQASKIPNKIIKQHTEAT